MGWLQCVDKHRFTLHELFFLWLKQAIYSAYSYCALWKVKPTLVFKCRTLTRCLVFSRSSSWGNIRSGYAFPKLSVALGYGGKRQPTAKKWKGKNAHPNSLPIIVADAHCGYITLLHGRPVHIHYLFAQRRASSAGFLKREDGFFKSGILDEDQQYSCFLEWTNGWSSYGIVALWFGFEGSHWASFFSSVEPWALVIPSAN